MAELVLLHIILVFPFNSEFTNEELNLYLKEGLSDIQPFKVELEGFNKEEAHGIINNYRSISYFI